MEAAITTPVACLSMNNHTTIKRAERSLHRSTVEGMAFGGVQGSGEHFVAA